MPGVTCVVCRWEHVRGSVDTSLYQHTQLIEGITVMLVLAIAQYGQQLTTPSWGMYQRAIYTLTLQEYEFTAPIRS